MSLYRKIEKFLEGIVLLFWRMFIYIHEMKNIHSKRHLYKSVVLTNEQKKQINDFYKKNYGKRVSYRWHRLYQSYTGRFDYRYLPEYIFSTQIELKRNKRKEVLPLENKNLLEIIFCNNIDGVVRTPKSYLMCISGTYFDENRDVITKKQAIEFLKNMNGGSYHAVIKKTVDTSSGRGVRILDVVDGKDVIENEEIESIIDKWGTNFVVQERIVPHEAFSNLYPKSINTLRVITYMTETKIKVAPIIMRIGRGGGYVDNAHAGGIVIAVDDSGKLSSEAFTEYQHRFTIHPDTNVVFDNYQLPCVSEIRTVAIDLHKKLPMLQFISWDFTVDENEKIVLIEANLHSQAIWVSQMAHGKACFGDDTAELLHMLSKKK